MTLLPLALLKLPLSPPPKPRTTPHCTFQKTNSHASAYYRALQNLLPNKTLFRKVAQFDSPNPPEVISLENPTEVEPSLILMTTNEHDTSYVPLFTHNCQIKHKLATLILDNESHSQLLCTPNHINSDGYKR
jgi:hypothetical protein